jgi:hypothetical protein
MSTARRLAGHTWRVTSCFSSSLSTMREALLVLSSMRSMSKRYRGRPRVLAAQDAQDVELRQREAIGLERGRLALLQPAGSDTAG